jgi:hypothetical protein
MQGLLGWDSGYDERLRKIHGRSALKLDDAEL